MQYLKPRARDLAAITIVTVYVLPIIWWGISAFTPSDALLDLQPDAAPRLHPHAGQLRPHHLGAEAPFSLRGRALPDSVIVALLSTIDRAVGRTAHGLCAFVTFRGQDALLQHGDAATLRAAHCHRLSAGQRSITPLACSTRGWAWRWPMRPSTCPSPC